MAQAILTFAPAIALRIATALGKTLGLTDDNGQPRAANMGEYEDWLRDVTRRMVKGQEMRDAEAALAEPPDVTIT